MNFIKTNGCFRNTRWFNNIFVGRYDPVYNPKGKYKFYIQSEWSGFTKNGRQEEHHGDYVSRAEAEQDLQGMFGKIQEGTGAELSFSKQS